MVAQLVSAGKCQVSIPFEISEKIAYLHSLLDLGYWIFPLHDLAWIDGRPVCTCHLGARCPGPGKHPMGRWSAPLDPRDPQAKEYIREVVSRWPVRGFGLHVGKSGLAVLDIDPRHGGNETVFEFVGRDLLEPVFPTVHTGGGGGHRYFVAPAGTDPVRGIRGPNGRTSTNIALGPGLEFFTGQHYVVLPYSPHASGGWYTLGEQTEVLPVPQELLAHINEMEVFLVETPKPQEILGSQGHNAAPTARAEYGDQSTREARARAWLTKRDPAIAGRNGRRFTAATCSALTVDFGLDAVTSLELLIEWNARCVPPWPLDQLQEILAWADGRPGERGAKLRQRRSGPFHASSYAPYFLSTVTLGLATADGVWELALDGSYKLTPHAPRPTLSPEELAGITGTPPQSRAAQTGPEDDDDDDVDDDDVDEFDLQPDHADTPLFLPDPGGAAPTLPPEVNHEGPRCDCAFRVLLHDPIAHRLRVCFMPGRRWDCPACGPKRREHYRATIRHHLADWSQETQGMAAENLWVAIVPREIWRRVGSSLRLRHASFFRLDHSAMGEIKGETFLVVSTERTRHLDWQPVSPQAAGDRLCATIDRISSTIRVRVWWSSRNWQLLPDRPPKPPVWKRAGRLRPCWQNLRNVLAAWLIELTPVRCAGRFWGWHGYQGRYPPEGWADLSRDLDEGVALSKLAIELGLDPREGAGGWDGAATTPAWT